MRPSGSRSNIPHLVHRADASGVETLAAAHVILSPGSAVSFGCAPRLCGNQGHGNFGLIIFRCLLLASSAVGATQTCVPIKKDSRAASIRTG